MEPKYAIGTKYKPVGKSYICTVTDILRTFNSANEMVKIRYVATHEFAGQTVADNDVLETSIARGLMS